MRSDIRVEPGAVTTDAELTNQAVRSEQIERVVDRRLRDTRTVAIQCLGDLLGRQMLRRGQQDAGNPKSLLGDPDAAGRQPLGDTVHTHGWQYNAPHRWHRRVT